MESDDPDDVAWMKQLGTSFVSVWFFVKGKFISELHVDDPMTLEDTVRGAMWRCAARSAVYPWNGRWVLYTPYRLGRAKRRYYDTQEAAEMVALHNA